MLHPARLSVCLSVCPPCASNCHETGKPRKLLIYITLDKRDRGENLRPKGQRSRSLTTGNENIKIVFAHIVVKSGSIYVKPRSK